jgi:hypothetical protein
MLAHLMGAGSLGLEPGAQTVTVAKRTFVGGNVKELSGTQPSTFTWRLLAF